MKKRDNWFTNYHCNKEVSRFNKLKKDDFYKQKLAEIIGVNVRTFRRWL